MTEPFEVYDARTILVQNIFSLSLIQRWRAANTGVDMTGLKAEVTKRDVMDSRLHSLVSNHPL